MSFIISAFSPSSNRYITLSLKSFTSFSLAKARVAAHAVVWRRWVKKGLERDERGGYGVDGTGEEEGVRKR
jgi:hypothetical protein